MERNNSRLMEIQKNCGAKIDSVPKIHNNKKTLIRFRDSLFRGLGEVHLKFRR